jgi:hypothetical protein
MFCSVCEVGVRVPPILPASPRGAQPEIRTQRAGIVVNAEKWHVYVKLPCGARDQCQYIQSAGGEVAYTDKGVSLTKLGGGPRALASGNTCCLELLSLLVSCSSCKKILIKKNESVRERGHRKRGVSLCV